MGSFFLTLELSGNYVSSAPSLQILLDGQLTTSALVTKKVGTGYSTITFELNSTSLSSLSFQFQDNLSEPNRAVHIKSVAINGQVLEPAMILQGAGTTVNPQGDYVLDKGENIGIDIAAADFLFGGNEPTLADLGTVTINGTNAGEKIVGLKTSETLDGGAGNDDLRAGMMDDKLYGGDGDDQLFGHGGNDLLVGGDGNDALYGRYDNDLMYGGAGNDRVHGDWGNDIMYGNTGIDRMYGGDGNDIMDGGADDDIMYGQAGDDTMLGGTGNDRMYTGSGNDTLDGGDGDDKIYAEGGSNTLNGGAGNDKLVADADSQQDTLNGGDGDDFIYGESQADILNGDAGDDRIDGKGGNDVIDGGDGSDLIFGQTGNDTIYGGDGLRDDLYGGDGNDTIYGQAGFDKIFGDGGNDVLHGGDGDDIIRGGIGTDILNGDAGNDRLFGEDGNDILNGGDGDDVLRGLAGADIVNGGAGNDEIIYDDALDVTDGGSGYDILRLSSEYTGSLDATAGDLNAVNIEQISLNNYGASGIANALTMTMSDISSISGSNTLYITGESGIDTVTVRNLDEVGDLVGTISIGTTTFNHYQQGGSNLYIQNNLALSTSDAPTALDDSFTGNEETNVTGNLLSDNGNGADSDPNSNPLSVIAGTFTTTLGNTVVISANGDFTYTPGTDFFGTDTFNYTLQNTLSETDTGLVTIDIANVNDGPNATNEDFTATQNIPLSGNLIEDNGNGADSDTETAFEDLTLVAETITSLNGGTVQINADGTFTYTPATGYIGPDSFSYTLQDEDGGTDTANVTVLVQDANALPSGDVAINFEGSAGDAIPNNIKINTDASYDQKTTAISFSTASDVTTRQTVYEQGGTTRGINIFIENGQLHMSVWNYAEENWGYKEVTTNINGGQDYTAIFEFNGALPANGSITGYLNGSSIGSTGGVGLLYGHSGGIGVGQVNGNTIFNNSGSNGPDPLLGDVEKIVQYNEILTSAEKDQLQQYLDTPSAIFTIEDVTQQTVPNDPAINDGGPYSEKTMSIAFVTGTDVTSRQVIYEQGGTTRGMSIFIEAGMLHIAAWNYAEENWGYKDVSTAINAEQFYTSTLLLDGALPTNGTLTGYLDGVQFGQATGVGLLYNHPGDIGVGEMINGAVFHGTSVGGNNYVFDGTIERLTQYNDALEGANLVDLHSAMANANPNAAAGTFIGDANDNTIGGGGGDDNIEGLEGNDQLSGNGGNDTLRGGDGSDVLYGNAGDDFLYGDAGDDILVGGSGLDVLYGGAGNDVFGFVTFDGNIDQIRDFNISQDKINISDVLQGYEVGTSDITDFVFANVVNSNRMDIRLDVDGDGSGYEIAFSVRGADFTGNSVQDLIDNNLLIVDQSVV